MQYKSAVLALLASASLVNTLPIPDPDNNCIGSSFSPTNCNSPNSGQINVDPTLDVSPTVNLKEREEVAAPLEEREEIAAPLEERDGNCIGSSFSPTNCNSPNSNQVNVDPNVNVSPSVDASGVTDVVNDAVGAVGGLLGRGNDDTVGSSFSPTNSNSPGSDQVNVKPQVDVSPTIDARDEVMVEEEKRDNNCIGSSFSPTNCNSAGSNQLNADPNLAVNPTIG